jgi:hypothetical protein
MKLRAITVFALLALMAGVAFGHGDKKHVIGVLESINADSVVVKTADGKSVEVKLVTKTVYVDKEGKPSELAKLAVGDRVVIHATPKGETLEADEVRFSQAKAGLAPAASKPKS